jgi:hypothetical protein
LVIHCIEKLEPKQTCQHSCHITKNLRRLHYCVFLG